MALFPNTTPCSEKPWNTPHIFPCCHPDTQVRAEARAGAIAEKPMHGGCQPCPTRFTLDDAGQQSSCVPSARFDMQLWAQRALDGVGMGRRWWGTSLWRSSCVRWKNPGEIAWLRHICNVQRAGACGPPNKGRSAGCTRVHVDWGKVAAARVSSDGLSSLPRLPSAALGGCLCAGVPKRAPVRHSRCDLLT